MLSLCISVCAQVTLQVRARPLREVLADISTKTGQKLEVEGKLAEEILILDVQKVELAVLRAQIAKVMDASWEKTEASYRLARTAEQTKAIAKADYERRVAWLRSLIEAKKLDLAKAPTIEARIEKLKDAMALLQKQSEDPSARMGLSLDGPMFESPAGFLANELFVSLSPEELASIPPLSRVSYSNFPNRAQRPLPVAATKLIENYKDAEIQLAALEPPPNASFGRGIFESAKKLGGFGKILFGIRRSVRGLTFWVSIYTGDGFSRDSATSWTENIVLPPSSKPTLTKGRATLSPDSVEFQKLAQRDRSFMTFPDMINATKPAEVSKEMLGKTLNPEKNDPLSYFVSDALFSMAKQRGKMLVARVPDSFFSDPNLATSPSSIELPRFESLLSSWCSIDEGEQFLTVKPLSSLDSESFRLPRKALGQFVRSCYSTKTTDLRTICLFYAHAGASAKTSSPFTTYSRVLIKLGVEQLRWGGVYSAELFALLGSLSDADWSRLERGYELPIWQYVRKNPDAASSYDPHFVDGSKHPDLAFETTEFWSNGIWTGVSLRLEMSSDFMLYQPGTILDEDGSVKGTMISLTPLDRYFQGQIAGNPAANISDYFKNRKISVGEQSLRKYIFRLTPEIESSLTMRLNQPPAGPAKTYDQLSEKEKAALQKAFDKARGG